MTRDPLPAAEDKATAVRSMFDRIAPRYDLVNRVMTFGMDVAWRKKAVASLRIARSAVVADVACGTGDLCREIERAGGTPVGIDYSFGMLRAARIRVPLVQGDALRLPLRDGSVSGVTCGFALRNVTSIPQAFTEFARVLRTGARVAILEVDQPQGSLRRAGHDIYFRRIVPLVGAALSDGDAYRYLPASTAYLPSTAELLDELVAAGFTGVARERLGFGAAQLVTGRRR